MTLDEIIPLDGYKANVVLQLYFSLFPLDVW